MCYDVCQNNQLIWFSQTPDMQQSYYFYDHHLTSAGDNPYITRNIQLCFYLKSAVTEARRNLRLGDVSVN